MSPRHLHTPRRCTIRVMACSWSRARSSAGALSSALRSCENAEPSCLCTPECSGPTIWSGRCAGISCNPGHGRCYGASGGEQASSSLGKTTECPMPQFNGQSRSHTALKQDSTLIAVLEMSQSSWLVAGLVPGIERHPLKKIEPDEATLLRLLRRWQEEATKAGPPITRITLAFEAGRDGVGA